jgi:hypothetical protein
MATAHRYEGRSQYFLACFTGPDGTRFQLPTRCRKRGSALRIALAMEKTANLVRDGALSQAKAKLTLDSLAPLEATVIEQIRRILNEWLILCDGDLPARRSNHPDRRRA